MTEPTEAAEMVVQVDSTTSTSVPRKKFFLQIHYWDKDHKMAYHYFKFLSYGQSALLEKNDIFRLEMEI